MKTGRGPSDAGRAAWVSQHMHAHYEWQQQQEFLLYSWLVGRFLSRHLELGYNKLLCCPTFRGQENRLHIG